MTPLRLFRYGGTGVAEPIVFQEDMPLLTASADRTPGWFGIDTGNSGALIMLGPFLQRHGFLKRYALGTAATGSGTGGIVHTLSQAIDRFSIAGRTFHHLPALFVVGQHGGSFSSTTEAGNAGYNILANFVPTFDYRRGRIYFELAARGPMPPYGRSGLGLAKPTHDVLRVASVRPHSPAAEAGIAIGDRIVAIDGNPRARSATQTSTLSCATLPARSSRSISFTLRSTALCT